LGVPFFPLFVVTLAVAVDELVPFSVTEAGEILQVAPVGAPEQLRAIAPVNPLKGVTLSE
jgi:hypothetical protein